MPSAKYSGLYLENTAAVLFDRTISHEDTKLNIWTLVWISLGFNVESQFKKQTRWLGMVWWCLMKVLIRSCAEFKRKLMCWFVLSAMTTAIKHPFAFPSFENCGPLQSGRCSWQMARNIMHMSNSHDCCNEHKIQHPSRSFRDLSTSLCNDTF